MPSDSTVRVFRYSGLDWYGCRRSMFIHVTSMSGRPWTIQCATILPMPPPVRMPTELSPAHTKKFRSSGASPTIGRRSGVKLSGPQKNFLTPVDIAIGTRCIAFSTYGPIRSQSGWISPNEKSSGIRPTFHGAQIGSNSPIIRPPTSSRK